MALTRWKSHFREFGRNQHGEPLAAELSTVRPFELSDGGSQSHEAHTADSFYRSPQEAHR